MNFVPASRAHLAYFSGLLLCCFLGYVAIFQEDGHFEALVGWASYSRSGSGSLRSYDFTNQDTRVILMQTDAARVKYVREYLQQKLSYLNVTIWPAVTPSQLADAKYQRLYYNKTFSDVRQGAIGCTVAHITLLEHFVASGRPRMLVLEDDVEMPSNFEYLYAQFLRHVPADFDLCQLLHHVTSAAKYRHRKEYAMPSNPYVMKGYGSYGTPAYLVSRKGAIKLLEGIIPIYDVIDMMFIDLIRSNRVVSYMPTLNLTFRTWRFESNIWKTKFEPLDNEADATNIRR